MPDPFLDEESAVETSRPREGYDFVLPAITYRLASGDEDVTIDGNIYRASPGGVKRTSVPVSASGGGSKALTVTIPVAHAVAQRWLRGGNPPKFLRVTVRRENNGSAERIWYGEVTSGSPDGDLMHFTVPSRLSEATERRLPVALAGRDCPHVLYDSNCKIAESAFQVTTTILNIQGRVVTVASMDGHEDGWADFTGFVRHPLTGEELSVFSQVGTTITLQLPLDEAQVGDQILVFAGCAHDVTTCRVKFGNNQINYGGSPGMPFDNPHMPGSRLGVVVQS